MHIDDCLVRATSMLPFLRNWPHVAAIQFCKKIWLEVSENRVGLSGHCFLCCTLVSVAGLHDSTSCVLQFLHCLWRPFVL